jgi:hypothetical protein
LRSDPLQAKKQKLRRLTEQICAAGQAHILDAAADALRRLLDAVLVLARIQSMPAAPVIPMPKPKKVAKKKSHE